MSAKHYTVVGMMSGTSLDGIDLIISNFYRDQGKWNHEICRAVTVAYTPEWKDKLNSAAGLDAGSFMMLHQEYGSYIGDLVNRFLAESNTRVDLVASHGHTVFHQPEKGLTFQLGSGAALAARCRITTVSDFRTFDVALGGQGAPLVPIGDELLFGNYSFCLNLGGFANISNRRDGKRIACDIGPVNIVANHLASRSGLEYDRDGIIGSQGRIIPELVAALNALDFFKKPAPKSLGREWVEEVFYPVLRMYDCSAGDLLRSVYEHMAIQLASYINAHETGDVLVTGGGAFNSFLIELLRQKSRSRIIIPDDQLVKFKEALIFAFLGLLRNLNEINCLASVTGARQDSSSGIVHVIW